VGCEPFSFGVASEIVGFVSVWVAAAEWLPQPGEKQRPTVSSAPHGQQYRARRDDHDGGWTATSRRAKEDDAARMKLMDMAEEFRMLRCAGRIQASATIEEPRAGIAAQVTVQDVHERLLFLRGGAWRVHYSDHCQWSSVEWSQKIRS
jgi:hypothetical protein